jgi:hypothetical protein
VGSRRCCSGKTSQVLAEKLTSLVNAPDVVKAIQVSAPPAAPSAPAVAASTK